MEVRQNIVVFTGADISKESGILTFRDMDGMWKKYDAIKHDFKSKNPTTRWSDIILLT